MIKFAIIVCLLQPCVPPFAVDEDPPEVQMTEEEFREKCERACGRG